MSAGGVQQARAGQLNDCGEGDPSDEELQISAEQKQKVARLIAGWPDHDAETATELMLMLGVHPSQSVDYDPRVTLTVPLNRVMA